jgi:hypothetical protein
MRRMNRPNLNNSDVYLACVQGTNNAGMAQLYANEYDGICANANLYRARAIAHGLFQFAPSTWGNDNQLSFGQLTKSSLNELYTKGLVASQEGRPYYDLLMATAPLGKCPYCQFGQVETLDHFLPKARYPSLSIVADNLVPACMSCNKGKGSNPVTEENQISHPYFENARIMNEIWLHAEITQTDPVTSSFSVDCPIDWPTDLSNRIKNYFKDFKLSKRYAVEAASELVSISAYLTDLPSSETRMEHLNRIASHERKILLNGWKAALYEALARSEWYGNVGFAGLGDA